MSDPAMAAVLRVVGALLVLILGLILALGLATIAVFFWKVLLFWVAQ